MIKLRKIHYQKSKKQRNLWQDVGVAGEGEGFSWSCRLATVVSAGEPCCWWCQQVENITLIFEWGRSTFKYQHPVSHHQPAPASTRSYLSLVQYLLISISTNDQWSHSQLFRCRYQDYSKLFPIRYKTLELDWLCLNLQGFMLWWHSLNPQRL